MSSSAELISRLTTNRNVQETCRTRTNTENQSVQTFEMRSTGVGTLPVAPTAQRTRLTGRVKEQAYTDRRPFTNIRDAVPHLATRLEQVYISVSTPKSTNQTAVMAPEVVQLATLAQNHVKYFSLLGMDPQNCSIEIYGARADSKCILIRCATTFAIGSSSDEELSSFYTLPVPLKSGKASGMTALAFISRGQSRDHDAINKHILNAFYLYCPTNSHLHPTSNDSFAIQKVFIENVLSNLSYKHAPEFRSAWIAASRVAGLKSHAAARSTLQDILDVGFDLKRKMQGRTTRGDLNPSQQGPWARESLKLDAELERKE
eukprot:IDg11102t1